MSRYICFTDIRGTELARLALYPQTSDKDRYARAVRSEVNLALKDFSRSSHPHKMESVIPLILSGVLRVVKHDRPVRENRETLETALDLITEVCVGTDRLTNTRISSKWRD